MKFEVGNWIVIKEIHLERIKLFLKLPITPELITNVTLNYGEQPSIYVMREGKEVRVSARLYRLATEKEIKKEKIKSLFKINIEVNKNVSTG
jgi:hypothetical protein